MCTSLLIIPNNRIWYIEYLVQWIMTLDQSSVIRRDDPGHWWVREQGFCWWLVKQREESQVWKVRSATPLECTHLHRPQKKSEVQEKRKNLFCKLEVPMKIYVHYMERWEQQGRFLSKWQRTGPQSLGTGSPNKLNLVSPPQQASNTNT